MTDLLTSMDAAARLSISERTLRILRKKGLISYVAITDRKIRYRPEDCEEFLVSRARRDKQCDPISRPRVTGKRRKSGVVIPFERLAAERGW